MTARLFVVVRSPSELLETMRDAGYRSNTGEDPTVRLGSGVREYLESNHRHSVYFLIRPGDRICGGVSGVPYPYDATTIDTRTFIDHAASYNDC